MAEGMHNSPCQRVTQNFSRGINNSLLMVTQQVQDKLKPTMQMVSVNDGMTDQRVVQRMFAVGKTKFKKPASHEFTLASASKATEPIPRGEAREEAGRGAGTGVEVGDIGSYGYVQYLEEVGDGLTGDHQPSGAAVKESIRNMLHTALDKPLTRSMAKNAYQKAITLVMTEAWHTLDSRTYGGRNSKKQIVKGAQDLMTAAMEDWKTTVPGLKSEGFTDGEIKHVWDDLCVARQDFFATGEAQVGTL